MSLDCGFSRSTAGKTKGRAWRNGQDFALFCGNEENVTTVASLFKDVFKASKNKRSVANRYHLFLLLLMTHSGTGHRENAFSVMFRSMSYSRYASGVNEAAALIMDICDAFCFRNAEEFAALNLGYSAVHREADLVRKLKPSGTLSSLEKYGGRAKHTLGVAISEQKLGSMTLEALGLSIPQAVALFELRI